MLGDLSGLSAARKAEVSDGPSVTIPQLWLGIPETKSLLENTTPGVLAMLPMNFIFKMLKFRLKKEPQIYSLINK